MVTKVKITELDLLNSNLDLGTGTLAASSGTFSGALNVTNNVTTGSGTLNLIGTTNDASIRFNAVGGGADKKKWEVRAIGASGSEYLQFRKINDANTLFTELMALDQSGNLGLGIQPSAWGSTNKAMDLGSSAAFGVITAVSSPVMACNAYHDGSGWKYKGNGYASWFQLYQNTFTWYTAASNSSGAGAPITSAQPMTLNASGNLGIGVIPSGTIRTNIVVPNSAEQVPLAISRYSEAWAGSNGAYSAYNPRGCAMLITSAGASLANNAALINFDVEGANGYMTGAGIGAMAGTVSNDRAQIIFTQRTGASTFTTAAQFDTGGNFRPGVDNLYTCGYTGVRWASIWSANGTVQTSDIREKTDINTAPGLDFITKLNPVTYKWVSGGNEIVNEPVGTKTVIDQEEKRDAEGHLLQAEIKHEEVIYEERVVSKPGTRTHFGLLAQEVKSVADELNMDFGGWIKTDPNDPDSSEGLRYDQFISPLIKAVQEQQAMILALQQEVAALKAK